MEETVNGRIEERLRSVFPEGAITRVEVLKYGDDPEVEPQGTAFRVFIDRAGRPEGKEADHEVVDGFAKANHAALRTLRDELPRFMGWVEFRPESPDGVASTPGPAGHNLRIPGHGPDGPRRGTEAPEEFTPVMTRLGPADLETVDTLIAAGIANSRAEVMRWALSRIREHPAYAQLQQRVHEIDELKAQF